MKNVSACRFFSVLCTTALAAAVSTPLFAATEAKTGAAPAAAPSAAKTDDVSATPAPAPATGNVGPDAGSAAPAAGPSGAEAPPAAAVDKEKLSPEEREKLFHEKTPGILADKLSLGLGLGLGGGKAQGNSAFSTDNIGFHFQGLYALKPLTDTSNILVEARYSTVTGIDTKADVSNTVQYWLVGGGLDFRLAQFEKLRLIGTGNLGVTKTSSLRQFNGERTKSAYSGSVGIQARAAYRVWKKIEGFSGIGIQVGKYTWADLQVGVLGTF